MSSVNLFHLVIFLVQIHQQLNEILSMHHLELFHLERHINAYFLPDLSSFYGEGGILFDYCLHKLRGSCAIRADELPEVFDIIEILIFAELNKTYYIFLIERAVYLLRFYWYSLNRV